MHRETLPPTPTHSYFFAGVGLVVSLVTGCNTDPDFGTSVRGLNNQATPVAAALSTDTTEIACGTAANVSLQLTGDTLIKSGRKDIVLVLDRSSSMTDTNLTALQDAAKAMIDTIDRNMDGIQDGVIGDGHRVGLVSFAQSASIDVPLSTDAIRLKNAIDSLVVGGGTHHAAGLSAGQAALSGGNNADVLILVTAGPTTGGSDPLAAARAVTSAGTELFAIGIANADAEAMDQWVSAPMDEHLLFGLDASLFSQMLGQLAADVTFPAASNATIQMTLSSHFQASQASATIGTVSAVGRTVTWSVNRLFAETATLTFAANHDRTQGIGAVSLFLAANYFDDEGNPVSLTNPSIGILSCAPSAGDDVYATIEDTPLVVAAPGVLANDVDPEGEALSASVTGGSSQGGTVQMASDGGFTYTPRQNFFGLDTFVYEVCDPNNACDTATASISVSPENDPPVAQNDAVLFDEDTSATVAVLNNDSDPDGDTLEVVQLSPPGVGTAQINPDGTIGYQPAANFCGQDNLTYTVSDGNGGTDMAVVSLQVVCVNDPPIANDDTASTSEDTDVIINVVANDIDIDGNLDASTLSILTAPTRGTAMARPDGTVSYAPTADVFGTDGFTYRVCDSTGACASASVVVDVAAVNDPPVAVGDAAITSEDVAVVIDVAQNDSDIDGNLSLGSVQVVATPANGAASASGAGTVTYTPSRDFNGTDRFDYRICDNEGACATASVNLTVTPVNDAPVGGDDAFTLLEDTPLTVSAPGVLANDTDVDGDAVTVASHTLAGRGTVTVAANGSVSYTPDADACGPDSFSYVVTDASGATDSAQVSLQVTCVNDPPVAVDDAVSALEDTAVTADVLANDSDIDGNLEPSSVLVTVPPTIGAAVPQANGTIIYTPNADQFGTDSFTYSVCDSGGACATAVVTVDVAAVPDAPVAVNDAVITPEDTAVTIDVAANDVDVDGDLNPTTAVVLTDPAQGTAVGMGDGTVLYTPALDFSGSDSFTYRICDESGTCDSASVAIDVTPVNDAPNVVDDVVTTPEDTPVSIAVLANDSDVEGNLDVTTVAVTGGPSNGTTSTPGDGTVLYTPAEDYFGSDSFTYRVCDTDGACASGTVTINITPVNDDPRAADDIFDAIEDTVLEMAPLGVLDNDVDPDPGQTLLIVESHTSPVYGTSLVLGPNGAFIYVPAPNWCGADTFTYVVSDGNGGTAGALVTINVACVNDLPVAVADSGSTHTTTPVTIDVAANDSDVENELDPTTVSIVNMSLGGTASSNGNGTVTYQANANFGGTDVFTYQICDTQGGCSTADVSVNVTGGNQAPVAVDDTFNATEDTVLLIGPLGVLENDSDPDQDLIYVVQNTLPPNGWVSVGPSGAFTYVPNPDYCGTDAFTYTVSDGTATDTGDVSIEVACVNDPPTARNDEHTTTEDATADLPSAKASDEAAVKAQDIEGHPGVLVNDVDPEGDTLTVAEYDSVSRFGGQVTMRTDGRYTYVPARGFAGVDTFQYTVSDGQGGLTVATVTSTVTATYERRLSASFTDWSQTDDGLVGQFVVYNRGHRNVQVLGHALEVSYRDSAGEWVSVAVVPGSCQLDVELPYLVQTLQTVAFSGCQTVVPVPAGAPVRLAASTRIFHHLDRVEDVTSTELTK